MSKFTVGRTVGRTEIDNNWQGKYFKNIPLTLTAIPEEGYIFDGWQGDTTIALKQITIPMEDATTLTAVFTEIEQPVPLYESLHFIVINELILINSNISAPIQYQVADIHGRVKFKGKTTENSIVLPKLSSGLYIITISQGSYKQSRIWSKLH